MIWRYMDLPKFINLIGSCGQEHDGIGLEYAIGIRCSRTEP